MRSAGGRIVSLAGVLAVAAGLLPALPASAQTGNPRPPTASKVSPVVLRAGSTPAHTFVAPLRPAGQVSAQHASIVVTFESGFPAQAQTAFQYGASLLGELINSGVTITVDASWTPLPSGVLAATGPSEAFANFAGAPQADTFYPKALANAINGSQLDATQPDILSNFNSGFPSWYFGTDGNDPNGAFDLATVALHELMHGVGFVGSMDVPAPALPGCAPTPPCGVWGFDNPPTNSSFPLIFDTFGHAPPHLLLSDNNNSTQLAQDLTGQSGGDAFFSGTNTNAAGGPAQLYSPNPWVGGGSFSHLDRTVYPAGNVNSLMTPVIDPNEVIRSPGPLALAMLEDTGWTIPVAPPSAPTIGTASPLSGGASVAFTPPGSDGGSAITAYKVTASPGGATGFGPQSPVPIAGLTNGGGPYTFTVQAMNAFGLSPPSGASNSVTPALHGFHSVAPVRILDTRFGNAPGCPTCQNIVGPLAPQSVTTVQVTINGGAFPTSPVPDGADSVVVNVTATNTSAPGWFTLWPTGSPPTVSNLNFSAGQTVPNLVTVKLKSDGTVLLGNTNGCACSGTAQAVFDVVGYYTTSPTDTTSTPFQPLASPDRILDTRFGTGPGCPTCQNIHGPLAPSSTTNVGVTSAAFGGSQVPANADSVVINVTATDTSAAGWLTVWPSGTVPNASNLNFVAGETVPNLVTVKLAGDGTLQLGNTAAPGGPVPGAGSADVIFDVIGYFKPAGSATSSGLNAVPPVRIVDTRFGVAGANSQYFPLSAGSPIGTFRVAGLGGTPTVSSPGPTAVIINVTVTGPTSPGWLTIVADDGSTIPNASNLNYVAGQTVPNLVVVKIPSDGKIRIVDSNGSSSVPTVDVIVDVAGWYG